MPSLMMPRRRRSMALAGCVATGLLLPSAASALVWDNGAGNFLWDVNTSVNFSGAVWPNATVADFDGAGTGTITVSGPVTASDINITADGYTFQGDAIGGNAQLLLKTGTTAAVTLNSDNTFTGGVRLNNNPATSGSFQTVNIGSNGALGTGNLVFDQFSHNLVANNSSGGTLALTNNIILPDGNSTNVFFTGGDFSTSGNMQAAGLTRPEARLNIEAGRTVTINGALTGGNVELGNTAGNTGTLVLNGPGTINGFANTTSSNTNSNRGLRLTRGKLVVGHDEALGTAQLVFNNSFVDLEAGNGDRTLANNVFIRGGMLVNITGTNDLTLTGGFVAAPEGHFNINADSGHMDVNVVEEATTFTINHDGLYGVGRKRYIFKDGAGTMVLTGTPSTDIRVSIEAGTLRATDGSTLSSDSFLALNGGVFESSGDFTRTLKADTAFTNSVVYADQVRWGHQGGMGSSHAVLAEGGFSAFGGKLTVNINGGGADTFTWGSTGFVGNGNRLIFGSVHSDSEVEFVDNINLGSATRTVHVVDNAGSTADFANLSGEVSGTGGLNKTGAGTLALSGSNSYAGLTTVSEGVLSIRGSILGDVNVESGAMLTGQGVIGGHVDIADGGAFSPGNSPGNSPGVQQVGSETWNGGGSYLFEITNFAGTAGLDWDLLNVDTQLTVNADAGNPFLIDLVSFGGPALNFNASQPYNLLIATASQLDFLGGSFDPLAFQVLTGDFQNDDLGGTWAVSYDGQESLFLTFQPGSTGGPDSPAVPEPATLALVALASTALLGRRRVRTA